MKYKGKEIKTHLKENVTVEDITQINKSRLRWPDRLWSFHSVPNTVLFLGDANISLPELQVMYGHDIDKDELIEKGKDYLVNSVLDRYTITQRAEPGVKAMFCKAHIVEAFGISGIPKDVDIFIPIFACVSIPRYSVIYSSNEKGKRRASAGKITNILWYPTHKLVRCLVVPKESPLFDKSVYITANLLSGITDDNQTIMEVRNGHLLSGDIYSKFIECALRIELDDYNPKTRTTDTVYSIYETERYASHTSHVSPFPKDYTPLARHIGYSVKIDNFDITPTTCSTGFHFFDSVDEAADYISM